MRLYRTEMVEIAQTHGLVVWTANNTGILTVARLVPGATRRDRAIDARRHNEIAAEKILGQWNGIANSRRQFMSAIEELAS